MAFQKTDPTCIPEKQTATSKFTLHIETFTRMKETQVCRLMGHSLLVEVDIPLWTGCISMTISSGDTSFWETVWVLRGEHRVPISYRESVFVGGRRESTVHYYLRMKWYLYTRNIDHWYWCIVLFGVLNVAETRLGLETYLTLCSLIVVCRHGALENR